MMDLLLITSSVLVVSTNVCVCCMVICIKKLRTFTNYFVASLALSDILSGGVLLPLNYPGTPGSPVTGYVVSIIMVSGVANVCAVTWDRYLAIMSPFHYTERLRGSYKQVLVITWAFAVAYSLLPLIWHTDISSIYHKCYLVFSMTMCVIVPYILIVVAYVRIFRRLKTHMSQLKMFNISKKKREGARKASIEGKTVNVFLVVVAVFIFSWAPVVYMTLTEYVADRPDLIPTPLPFVSLIVLAVSSMVNPFLYAFMKRDFTRELLRIVMRRQSLLESPSRSSSHGSVKRYFYSLGRRISFRSSSSRRATISGGETRKKTSTSAMPTVLKRQLSEPRSFARKISRGSGKLKHGTCQGTSTLSKDVVINDNFPMQTERTLVTADNAYDNMSRTVSVTVSVLDGGGRRGEEVCSNMTSDGGQSGSMTNKTLSTTNCGSEEKVLRTFALCHLSRNTTFGGGQTSGSMTNKTLTCVQMSTTNGGCEEEVLRT